MMCFGQAFHKIRRCYGLSWSFNGAQLMAFAAVGIGLQAPIVSAADNEVPAPSFFEPFDRLDTNFWYISDGWTNGDHQNCTWSAQMVSVASGLVSLKLSKADGGDAFLCGEIQTNRRYGYGTYEARVKAATGSGLNSAFFSYVGPADHEKHDEIDFEVLGKNSGVVQVNQYIKAKGGNEKLVPLEKPADQAFTDFAFIREPSRLRFFVNGRLVNEVTDPSLIPMAKQKIFFSLWGTDTLTGWMGPFAYSGPVTMQIDWVSFTAAGEACLFPASLTCDPSITVGSPARSKESL